MLLQPGSFPGISHPQGLQLPAPRALEAGGKVQAQLSHPQQLQACKPKLGSPPGTWRTPLGSPGGVNVPRTAPAAAWPAGPWKAALLCRCWSC